MESTYTVKGMTCDHCVHHVTEEVSKVQGVTEVHVSLADGRMVVTSDTPVALSDVEAAVDEAGDYTVVPA